MSKRTALQLKEPNHEDPKITRLTNAIERKHRVVGVNQAGERVAYDWDGVTGEWRRDWEYGSTTPLGRAFGEDRSVGAGFAFDGF
ncbi:TPA: hypothetical protein QDB15_000021 [Burkholderia vietnamiensis]|uniref:Uncharacterized protein n=2 Tax=Burkholderiaceae TaxID=119060 RepID=A0A5E5P179_9BURK|nr:MULTISPECIES: hypothetical protein [Burkholderiaceae]AOZ05909.1 hypothetical protein BKK80_08795 [Cupriavidus malaysiensis]MCA8206295.1 hypothetical protein [Burkholderia vietnamiensis]VVG70436.1 hypothetical protein PAP18089_01396 [Pandoraea apista]HDR8943093.1 hypothetical protein [Burkholderia vietnamiensis]HDR9116297.1 hypothetical protein [Burkholderia vietnamiensis]